MKKSYSFFAVLLVPVIFLVFTSEVLFHTGSPGGKTGSPGDGGHNCTDCHAGTPITQEFWILNTDLALNGYSPGETYDIMVIGVDPDAQKFGFEATAEDANGSKVGTFQAGMMGMTQVINNGKSITHTALGNTPLADTGTLYMFTWTAPSEPVGDITFYAAINAANGNGNNSGDQIYLSQFTASPAVGIARNAVASLNVYPNPGNGYFKVTGFTGNDSEVEVFNLTGQVVFRTVLNTSPAKLNLSHLDEGVYFIRQGNASTKVVISK
ncbi:MAG: hypothetical protein Kow00127_03980 [Bacteroidales bacterium]